jgi:ligand-binding sensor domain-containing protein/signal transduction histidine kinase
MGKCIAFLALLLFLSSCSDDPPAEQTERQLPYKATGIMPAKDSIAPPKIVMLDTCAAPQVITIANTPGTGGPSPTLKPAVFCENITNYGAEQGLYSLINTIKKDRAGNFWLGTGGGGVIRYDGKTATSFTTAQGLASNNIRSIAEDKNGNFWFGSQGGGASFYDGRSFTKITKAHGLSSNNIRGIVIDTLGNTWFATYGGGISIYNGKSFTDLTSKNGLACNSINCILLSRDGTIWRGTDSGVSHCNAYALSHGSRSFVTYTTAQGLASNRILCMTEDRNGNIWLGTDGGGVCCLDPRADVDPVHFITTYTIAQGLPDNKVKGIFEDTKGKIWLCTPGGGVCCYDPFVVSSTPAHSAFNTYTTEQGLATNKIECAAEDENGNIWFGTNGGGVTRFDGESFKINVAPRGVTRATVTCIKADKSGNIWLSANEGGVSCYDGKYFRDYQIPGMTKDNYLTSVLEDRKGGLWFGASAKGIYRLDERPLNGHPVHFSAYSTAQGFPGRISCLAEDTSGNIWMGTDAGVFCYDGKSVVNYTTAQGLGNNAVWSSLADKRGNIWFGTFGGGLSMFVPHPADGGAARFISYTTAQGLPSNSIKNIAEDECGNIWLGTGGGGVSRFDGNSFTNYTTIHGLANNIVVLVSEDKSGHIWFGTNEGFGMLKGYRGPGTTAAGAAVLLPADNNKSNNDIAANYTPVFEKYNFKNGIPVKDINTNAMYIDTAGVIWAGTADKLVTFDYNKQHKNTDVPHVFISAIQIGGEKICWYALKKRRSDRLQDNARGKKDSTHVADSLAMINEEFGALGDVSTPLRRDNMYRRFSGIQFEGIAPFYPLPAKLVLPYNNNNITFDFAATELSRPYLVRYQYFLEGYDKDWGPLTDRNSATFGNIHEGAYTFKLRAQSPDGVWSEPVTYRFEVLPPVYRTWWAYAFYCLVLIWIIYLIVHFRIGLLKKENARLEQVVSERTAQIEQEKAAVLMQANDLKKLNLFKDKTFSILSHDLRGPIHSSTAIVGMLNDGDISSEDASELKEALFKQLSATGVLLDNLLKWAKASMEGSVEPHPQEVNIYDITRQNATLFEESLKAKNIVFTNNVPGHITAWCDAEQTDIVIRNLLANAIKFTERNGRIRADAQVKDGFVQISVTDTGVGMTKEQLDKLFKPLTDNTTYGTEGEKGTGLGLLLSYDFIKANKGRIEVSSELGKGTTFTVVLPVGI